MSERLTIRSYRGTYTAEFIADYAATIREQLRPGDHLVVDRNVLELHAPLAVVIAQFAKTVLAPTESAKSYDALAPLIRELIEQRFTKANRLVAIGGGIMQDITAFTASILFRGVDWLFFPTNLLSQCDSCIGSKTSINFGAYKNQLGGFYPPRAVFIDVRFLETLPDREIRSGIGEMMHYFLVSGEGDLAFAEARLDQAKRPGPVLRELIHASLAIKQAMIERDEFDEGPRNVFNYGHSFGHALESTTDYGVPHGIAVSFGMDLANLLSHHLGLIAAPLRNRARRALARVWEGTTLPAIDVERFLAALARDKKNEGREIKVILTRGLGQMFKTSLTLDAGARDLIARFFDERLYLADL
jgi:3-dehydroquinate synthase